MCSNCTKNWKFSDREPSILDIRFTLVKCFIMSRIQAQCCLVVDCYCSHCSITFSGVILSISPIGFSARAL